MSRDRYRWVRMSVTAAATAAIAYRFVVRPWHEGWGATHEEREGPLPGDDLIDGSAAQLTRAITIDAPAEQVWPWVVQLGADRGGFYSYDWLENLLGLGIHSADAVVPNWQIRAVGDLVGASAAGDFGWYVMAIEPDRALVMKLADVQAGRPSRREEPPFMEFTWSFVLEPQRDRSTRLLVRERVAFGKPVARFAYSPVGVVSFVMTRKMLLGIKERAERSREDADAPQPSGEGR